jgi:hypothetical protein
MKPTGAAFLEFGVLSVGDTAFRKKCCQGTDTLIREGSTLPLGFD